VRESYLAIDLGAQRLAAGVVDQAGTLVIRDRVAAPTRHGWQVLASLISRVLAATPKDMMPTRCGVSCVGPIDPVSGQITPAHLPVWAGFGLEAELTAEYGLPVAIRTSGQGFALAEAWCGSAIGESNLLAILLSDVVEAGVISSGRLLRGHSGNAGSIAHLVVEPSGKTCSCGVQGCVDAYVGLRAIEEETNRTLERTPMALIERAGIMLGRAVASLSAISDPGRILIGGRALHFFGSSFELALHKEIAERSRLSHLRPLSVTVLGPEATSPLMRAAAIARSVATHE
jgi:glucokinase